MHVKRLAMEIATAAATGLIGVVICLGSLTNGIAWASDGPQAGYFPFYVGCLVVLGSLVNAARAVGSAERDAIFVDAEQMRALARFFLPLLGFVLLSSWLGLYVGMGVYILYATRVTARFRWPAAVFTAVLTVAVNFIIFEVIFTVPLLKGPVLEYFGIY